MKLLPSGSATVCGIIGQPVSHSLSPWMHQQFAQQLGLDFLYVPFPVAKANLATALRGMQALGLRGCNVTIPHKENLLPLLSDITPRAKAIGAVNTLVFGDSGILGDNTDGIGFERALRRHGVPLQGPSLIIGAGGAARAILQALGECGATPIYLANRTVQRAQHLATQFPHLPLVALPLEATVLSALLPEIQLLVNTTSRGLQGENHPEIHLEQLPSSCVLCDIVYNPLPTPLLGAAAARGLHCVDGLGMLVEQGAESFRIWTGQMPETAAVEDLLREWLSHPNSQP
ncbi:MAG: shikimate dehydrogenase [Acidithiobacillus sp.]|nr:shikimate dehydrogenase [Acidithiobacillus sp.]